MHRGFCHCGPARGHVHAAAARVLQCLCEQARLADPGLALDQHDRRPATSDTVQGLAQGLDLSLTPADPRGPGQRAHDRIVLRRR